MAEGITLDNNSVQKFHVLVAHDTSIFTFKTSCGKANPSSLRCIYKPPTAGRTYHAAHNGGSKYLDFGSYVTSSMIPSLYNKGQVEMEFTKNDISSKSRFEYCLEKFTNDWSCKRVMQKVNICGSNERIPRVLIKFGKKENMGDKEFLEVFLEYTYFEFTGNHFEGAVVEYTLTQKSFLRRCEDYCLYMFRDLSCCESVVTSKTHFHQAGSTTISKGEFRDSVVYVKEGTVQTVGDFLNLVRNESRVELQEGMPRMYERICDGVKFQIATEICLDISFLRNSEGNRMNSLKKNYWRLKEILHGAIKALIYLHDKKIVHGRIRPQHIFMSQYGSLRYAAKFGGMRSCIRIDELGPEMQIELLNRDIYDMGRTILATLDDEHNFPDNDDEAENCYKRRDQFKESVENFCRKDPLVGHLVKLCLSCKVTAKDMHTHFCFYEDGTYLEIMQRFSDSLKYSSQDDWRAGCLKAAIKESRWDILDDKGSWSGGFKDHSSWLQKFGTVKKFGTDKGLSIASYSTRNVFDLISLIRDVPHHFSQETKLNWPTPISFERHILVNFPQLFPIMHAAVVECTHPAFKHYLKPRY